MEKELVSAFVDRELNEKELRQLGSENRREVKELVNIYRVIGETIRYNQSRTRTTEPFQDRLKRALQREYSDSVLSGSEEKGGSSKTGDCRAGALKEESVA